MLVKSLKNQKQFDSTNHFGTKFNSNSFLLVAASSSRFLPEASHNTIFLGMKVGKKLSKKAVIRNKIKRRIRHLTKLVFKRLVPTVFDSVALIFIPKKGFESLSFQRLEKELFHCLSKVFSGNLSDH